MVCMQQLYCSRSLLSPLQVLAFPPLYPAQPYFGSCHRFHVLFEAHVANVRFVEELQCVVGEFIDHCDPDLQGRGEGEASDGSRRGIGA